MTREEAIVQIHGLKKYCEDMADSDESGSYVFDLDVQALDLAISALRPVSREQVEKVWRGEWKASYDELNGFTYVTCSKCEDETVLDGCFVTTDGKACGLENFCSVCGAPMTDEAVEMVMERINKMEETGDGLG